MVRCSHVAPSMKTYREELFFETTTTRASINITPQVETAVRKSGVREGLALVDAMHLTASVSINDDERGLIKDDDTFLEKLAPHSGTYTHNDTGEDDANAHIKRQIMGREVLVAITNGCLDFGPWSRVFMASSTDVGGSESSSRSSASNRQSGSRRVGQRACFVR